MLVYLRLYPTLVSYLYTGLREIAKRHGLIAMGLSGLELSSQKTSLALGL